MYRSQLLLQQLGISQWIPRTEQTVQQPEGQLWRDQQDVSGTISPESLVQAQVVAKVIETHSLKAEMAARVKPPVPMPNHQAEMTQPETAVHTSAVGQDVLEDEIEHPQTIAFDYHLLVHEKFVLCAEINTENEQRLFNQIVKACHASLAFIQWPLAIDVWQMNDYVLQSYLKGVFAIHQDKVFLHLGELPFPVVENIFSEQKSCASLQQLLESPEQKRALWQQLYPLVYDAESNNA